MKMPLTVDAAMVRRLAAECGFELAGVAAAGPAPDAGRFEAWVRDGRAGEMAYLTDGRAALRADSRLLFPPARSVICVGKLYNGPEPARAGSVAADAGWISRYAWGDDYHAVLRAGLERLAGKLGAGHEWKVCVDTAPLLERSNARAAGLGWIGKNTCLINQGMGSWFFLGELLTSLEIEPGAAPPDRCGSCTRCIDACPTQAIDAAGYSLDARACIAYFTIELRGPAPAAYRGAAGNHVFGCDICQDVCPWNHRAPVTAEPAFAPRHFAPPLERLAALGEDEFRRLYRASPISRARYSGFLRNVAIAMGNSGRAEFRAALERLAGSEHAAVRDAAAWALRKIEP